MKRLKPAIFNKGNAALFRFLGIDEQLVHHRFCRFGCLLLGDNVIVLRITSYNVCYTKLLR